jgi:hypothetical protein
MNLPSRLSKLLLLGIPFLVAGLAIAQDLHMIADFNACVKDIVFICLMLQLILHAWVGERLKSWMAGVVLVGWASTALLEPYTAAWLPDTWILSQREHVNGFPAMELLVLVLVSVALWFGNKNRTINRKDLLAYGLSALCLLGSARLWFWHLDYLAENPSYSWIEASAGKPITLIHGGALTGKGWMTENIDYSKTINEVAVMLKDKQHSHFWWGGLIGSESPVLMKLSVFDGTVLLNYQDKPLEWGGKTSWTWMGVASFILVFMEVYLLVWIAMKSFVLGWVRQFVIKNN